MKIAGALLSLVLLSACISSAVGVAGTAVGVAVKTTGAVAGAAVSVVTPHHRDRDDRNAPKQ